MALYQHSTGSLYAGRDVQRASLALSGWTMILTDAGGTPPAGPNPGDPGGESDVAVAALSEWIRDTIGTALVPGSGVAITPNDPGNTITVALSGGASQPADADLTTIAALDSATAGVLATDGSGWIRKTYAQIKTALSLAKADVGLGNVDNTSDANKPVSTAAQTALNGKVATTTTVTASTGLSGGGDLSANRSFAVSYGSSASTSVQGNDARVTADQAAATASIRTLGTGALQAASGTDARLLAGYGHGDQWDSNVYGDLFANAARDVATSPLVPQTGTNRSLWVLIGLAPAGTYTGFRIFRAAAGSGGTVSAALFSASTRGATTWNRLGAGNVAPTLTAQGQLDTALAFTLASDAWVGLLVTYTATATTYASYLSTVATGGTTNTAMLNPASGTPVAATGTVATAPGSTLGFPLTGVANLVQKPWVALY